MARVKDVMTTNVPRVSCKATVLDATNIMNKNKTSGVVVFDGEKVIGLVTDRRLLTEFLPLDKKPDEVKVGEIVTPFYRIGPNEDTKKAAKKIVEHRITRLGVFEGETFLGWVTAIDLSRHLSRRTLLDKLRSNNEMEPAEYLCPQCRRAFMEKITDREGQVLRWQCPKCGYSL